MQSISKNPGWCVTAPGSSRASGLGMRNISTEKSLVWKSAGSLQATSPIRTNNLNKAHQNLNIKKRWKKASEGVRTPFLVVNSRVNCNVIRCCSIDDVTTDAGRSWICNATHNPTKNQILASFSRRTEKLLRKFPRTFRESLDAHAPTLWFLSRCISLVHRCEEYVEMDGKRMLTAERDRFPPFPSLRNCRWNG